MELKYPVLKPLLPTADKLLPYLRQIDENRWYTNYGPLLTRFEQELAQHFAVSPDCIATSTNATLAIAQTLRAFDAPAGSVCVMPSWTFVATPSAAIWAGLDPYFIDVAPDDWLITPEAILEIARTRQVGAAIVVSAFGAPVDLAIWDRFTQQSGIPVIIDAAAGFDGFSGCGREGYQTPVVVSMHATKVSGIGEGAVIVTGDAKLAKKINMLGNFGFFGSRDAALAGTNAKMSEYTAANGLALLAEWPERRAGWAKLTTAFAAEVASIPELSLAPGFNQGWISSYGLVELPDWLSSPEMAELLRNQGIETRQWWGNGCHHQTAYKNCERGSLAVTEHLGNKIIGLPFWLGMSVTDIADIFMIVREILGADVKAAVHG